MVVLKAISKRSIITSHNTNIKKFSDAFSRALVLLVMLYILIVGISEQSKQESKNSTY